MKLIIASLILTSALIAGAAVVLTNFSFFNYFNYPQAQAQGGEIPFGGMRVFTLNCTCSRPNKLLFIQDYASNRLLKLLYVPGTSKIYDHQNPSGATYLLGSYESGGRNCWLRVGKKCIIIPQNGQLGKKPGTGTSR